MANDIDANTKVLFADALVWDNHSGFMPDPAADLDNLDIWKDAGVNYLSVNVGFDLMQWEDTVTAIAAFRHWIKAHPESHLLANCANDVRRAKSEGKLAITFDLEGMNALNGRIDMVELYHDLGVRQILFAYNRNNLAGGGCHDEDGGLTDFGRSVIDEMNRLGMFVDVSHCGLRTSMEVMQHSNAPVIFSHSNAKQLCDHGRNISDEQISACAATGGVIGAVGLDLFLGQGPSLTERMADHIDYLIAVAGPAHVGLGLDFGFPVEVADIDEIVTKNPEFWPVSEGYHDKKMDFFHPSHLVNLADTLLRRGHGEDVVRGVLGENFLRVADSVWKEG